MKPFYMLTEAELVSDAGIQALDEAVQWEIDDNSETALEKTIPVLTAEIRRLRSGPANVDVVIQLLERMTPGERDSVADYLDDLDEEWPAPPTVYGPLTYMQDLSRRLNEAMEVQLLTWGTSQIGALYSRPVTLVGLSEVLDHVEVHRNLAADDDHATHVAAHQRREDDDGR